MKKIAILLLVLCLSGCAQKPVRLDPQEAAKALAEASTGASPLSRLDPKAALTLYNLTDEKLVADACVYVGNSGSVDEVSVWKAADSAAAGVIEERIHDRINTQKDVYSDYRPDEIPKLDNAVIVRRGLFIVLYIDADAEAARKAVDALF